MSAAIRYPRPPELDQLGTRHAVVEASAGTGKTYLLEHLVVELLLNHDARMEEILVVTFTERATAELCHLSVEPGHATSQSCWLIDDHARRRLRDALLAFDRATISTIHGFCRGILRDHAFLHRRMFDEQAVDEKDAFHAAFVECLRNDFQVLPPARRGRSGTRTGRVHKRAGRHLPVAARGLAAAIRRSRSGRSHHSMARERGQRCDAA